MPSQYALIFSVFAYFKFVFGFDLMKKGIAKKKLNSCWVDSMSFFKHHSFKPLMETISGCIARQKGAPKYMYMPYCNFNARVECTFILMIILFCLGFCGVKS